MWKMLTQKQSHFSCCNRLEVGTLFSGCGGSTEFYSHKLQMTPISWGVDWQGCRGCWSCQASNGFMFSYFHCVSIFVNSAKKASKAVLEEACRTACCFSSPTRDRINWLLAFCCNTSLTTLSTSSLMMKSGLASLSSTATLAMSTRNLFAKNLFTIKWHHNLCFSHQLNAHKQFQNLLSWVIDGHIHFC